jgi:uncharacterized membrane protein YhaH (DUF805 family)
MHWFIDPVKNHYLDFEGRTGRKEFWIFSLFFVAIMLIPGFNIVGLLLFPAFLAIFSRRMHDSGRSGWWNILLWGVPALGLAVLIFLIVIYSADPVNPAPAVISMIVGVYGGLLNIILYIVAAYLASRKGDIGDNKYGPAPTTFSGTFPEETVPVAEVPQAPSAMEATPVEEENTKQGFGN